MSETTAPTPASASASTRIELHAELLDRVEAAVMAVDLSGRILFANRYVEQLYGWTPDELVGNDSAAFAGVAVSPEVAREIFEALRAHASWEGTFDVRRKDGTLVSVRAIDSALYDDDGELVGVVSLGMDASRERRVESLLQEQAAVAAVFRQLGDTLLQHVDVDALLRAVAEVAREAIGAETAAYFHHTADGDEQPHVRGARAGASREPFLEIAFPRVPTFDGDRVVRVDDVVTMRPAADDAVLAALSGDSPAVGSYLAAPVRSREGEMLAGLLFGHRDVGVFTDHDVELLSAIATQAGVAIDNALAHRSLEEQLADRRRAQEKEHFLARCAMVLASSLDYEQTFVALATMAVPYLADLCLIDVAESDGIRRMAAVHADPTRQALVDELEQKYPPDPNGAHPAVEALRSGEPRVSPVMTDQFLRDTTRDERHYEIVRELGFSSYMSVPLNARGRTLGSFTLVSCSSERTFDERDLAVATEVANHAAIAVDNARLYHDQQRARAEAESTAERLRQLQRLSARLSAAVSVSQVAAVMRDTPLLGLDTPSRGIWLLDRPERTLRLVPGSEPGTIAPRFTEIRLDAALPVAEVARTGAPIFVPSLGERDERFPALRDARTDAHSFAALPLVAEGEVIGVVVLAFAEAREFEDDEERMFAAVSAQCAQALSRAVLYDRERAGRDRAEADRHRIQELNRALQTSLLPPGLPEIPGVELSARYHPALAGLEVGGDFYDVFDTGGDWAVVVGDVCGKGPVAAAVTATARWTLRSVAMDVRQPAQVLRKLNETMVHQQLDDRFCTVVYCRVVPTAQGVRLSVCRGGHPAPMVLRADGEIEDIGTPGSLIGVLPEVRLWEETTPLQPGDAIVFYTDGVTESRRGREQFGEDRVRATLATCVGFDAAGIAQRLERAVLDFGGPEPSDDIAILVLRVPG